MGRARRTGRHWRPGARVLRRGVRYAQRTFAPWSLACSHPPPFSPVESTQAAREDGNAASQHPAVPRAAANDISEMVEVSPKRRRRQEEQKVESALTTLAGSATATHNSEALCEDESSLDGLGAHPDFAQCARNEDEEDEEDEVGVTWHGSDRGESSQCTPHHATSVAEHDAGGKDGEPCVQASDSAHNGQGKRAAEVSGEGGSKLQVIDGWQPGDMSLLLTGRDDEVILVLSPWESIHVVGSVSVFVMAGSCTVFGAKLSAVGGGNGAGCGAHWVVVHAVPPFGPMPIYAAGRPVTDQVLDGITSCKPVSSGADGEFAGGTGVERVKVKLKERLGESTPESTVACVVCLRRWQPGPPATAPTATLSSNPIASRACSATANVMWLKGRGLDAKIRSLLGGARIVLPWSNISLQPLQVPNDWQAAGDRVMSLAPSASEGSAIGQGTQHGMIGACVGPKGSGKSTMLRYLVNRLLSRHPLVYVLDADVGQAEFTPAGLVTLTAVRQPLLGPAHTHTVSSATQTTGFELVHAALFGDISPEADPLRFRHCIEHVCTVMRSKVLTRGLGGGLGTPVLVNTCGWVKGLGLELLQHLLDQSGASLVLVCQSGNPKKDLTLTIPKQQQQQQQQVDGRRGQRHRASGAARPLSGREPLVEQHPPQDETADEQYMLEHAGHMDELTEEAVQEASGVAWDSHVQVVSLAPLIHAGERPKVNAAELRAWQTLSYLTSRPFDSKASSMCFTSYLWSMASVQVSLDELQVVFLDACVAPSEVLLALNASLVALCVSRPAGQATSALGSGRLAASTGGAEGMEECVGLGLVRAVNAARRLLYILTPVGLKELQGVDMIVRARGLEVPLVALHPTGVARGGIDSVALIPHGRVAYLATESLSVAGTGSATMRSRSNIQRRGHQ